MVAIAATWCSPSPVELIATLKEVSLISSYGVLLNIFNFCRWCGVGGYLRVNASTSDVMGYGTN